MATPSLGLGADYGRLRRLSFDQDNKHLNVCGEGFRVRPAFECSPEIHHLDFDRVGPVDVMETLSGTGVAFVVPSSMHEGPKEWRDWAKRDSCDVDMWNHYGNTCLLVYDLNKPYERESDTCDESIMLRGEIGAYVEFESRVLNVKVNKKVIVVALMSTVHIFTLKFPSGGGCPDLFWTKLIDTRSNPSGLIELSPKPELALDSGYKHLLVFPGSKKGSIQLVDVDEQQKDVTRAAVYIAAHEGEIKCFKINCTSTMLATASERGTLIRIFDAVTLRQMVELRRGADQAVIQCINFSRDSSFLCCSSDKGTIHVFAIQDYALNRRSNLANLVPSSYHASHFSFVKFHVPSECACICAFGDADNNSDSSSRQAIAVLSYDGSYAKYEFSLDGSCVQTQFDYFTKCHMECKMEKLLRTNIDC